MSRTNLEVCIDLQATASAVTGDSEVVGKVIVAYGYNDEVHRFHMKLGGGANQIGGNHEPAHGLRKLTSRHSDESRAN